MWRAFSLEMALWAFLLLFILEKVQSPQIFEERLSVLTRSKIRLSKVSTRVPAPKLSLERPLEKVIAEIAKRVCSFFLSSIRQKADKITCNTCGRADSDLSTDL